ncbi:putative short chain dehydrogenase/reductase [Bisporella sp. PMI_857]|nr:putative short chain dehydrogenase/reductase [Bisporella sp. PMI_857]
MSGVRTYRNFSLEDIDSLQGKVAVVTGGNAGIGRDIVAQLLLHHIGKVYVLSHSKEEFQESIAYWKEKHVIVIEEENPQVDFMPCDLTDIVVVKKAADELFGKLDRLDIFISNAGLPTVPDYTLSPQGIETIWAANVVGPFVLTNILLPKIESTAQTYGDARIVVTTSSVHFGCQDLDLDSTMSKTRIKSPDNIDSCWRYARSKLGNILFTKELSKRLEKRGSSKYSNRSNGCLENIIRPLGHLMKANFWVTGQSTEDGAATALYLATSPAVVLKEQKGKYFIPIATEDETSKLAEDKDLAKNLWYWCDDKATKALGRGWDEVATKS